MKYSVLIVEDEFPAQSLLKRFVSSRSELELIEVVETNIALKETLSNNEFDLMLLDIHLHNKSSIDVIEEIDNLPYIIFTTADIHFAHKAFAIGAIDYLLKPFEQERFNQAINKFLTIRKNCTPFDMYRAIKEVDDDSKYKKSHLSEEKINEILNKLIEYIQSTKAYVNPKISLQSISKDIDESTNHISQVINQKLEKNFYEFIYQFRIDRVKKMMNDPAYDDLSILELCYEVGFNSKSVFNIVFKEFEKMTPSQYRLKMKSK